MSEHVSTPTSRHREASNIVMVRRYERPKMGLLSYESFRATHKPGRLELKWMREANDGATSLTFEQWIRNRKVRVINVGKENVNQGQPGDPTDPVHDRTGEH